jgi:hypothetical protein
MSFALRNLSVLAYANGFTLWHYNAGTDALPAVAEGGYFDDATDMLTGGDMMFVTSAVGGQMLCITAEETGLSATRLC